MNEIIKKNIGIVGCGAIGSSLVRYASDNLKNVISNIALYDVEVSKSEALQRIIKNSTIARDIKELFDAADLVIEAASSHIVPELVGLAIEKTKDIMIMSIGGFVGNENLIKTAREKQIRLILPSGAIGGIDALKASNLAGLKKVTLITRKPPKSLKGAPYLAEKGIDVDAIREETVIFEDSAERAIKVFPKNINISALLSIAGLGAGKTEVKIIVSPEYEHNVHEIMIESLAGNITVKVENVPSPDNPRTSSLAVYSAIVSLREYFESVSIGT